MNEILKKLCADMGISGRESGMLTVVRKLIGDSADVSVDKNGNIIASLGDINADKHIMIDAHIDRIGLIVTYIDDEGFIKAENVGGIDLRTLPSSAVKVFGREEILGVVCTVPPHLTDGDSEPSKDKIWIDTGLPADKVRELVSLGDSIILCSRYTELLNDCIAVSALDNRSGCAVLINTIYLLKDKILPCRVSFVFSVQEETNESGAQTAAFSLNPDEAVVIDVGFAKQDGVPAEKSGAIGCGGIISIAPVLSGSVTNKLIDISKRLGMECDYEVSGSLTGTNADKIAVSGSGVKTGVISVPSKNMHTQTEIVSLKDMEKISELLAVYITEGGAENA
ncbi:MAG: M42 family peptidase [Clostridia bacterium]|nr:M42 family peptidase [Clostridia bacterium]